MKKIITISVFTFIICSAFKVDTSIDYRDACTGVYACKKYTEKFSLETKDTKLDTSRVNITISKDAIDSVLQINVSGQILKAKLINSELQPYPLGGKYGGRFFATNNLDFYYTPAKTISSRYIGKKS